MAEQDLEYARGFNDALQNGPERGDSPSYKNGHQAGREALVRAFKTLQTTAERLRGVSPQVMEFDFSGVESRVLEHFRRNLPQTPACQSPTGRTAPPPPEPADVRKYAPQTVQATATAPVEAGQLVQAVEPAKQVNYETVVDQMRALYGISPKSAKTYDIVNALDAAMRGLQSDGPQPVSDRDWARTVAVFEFAMSIRLRGPGSRFEERLLEGVKSMIVAWVTNEPRRN